MASKSIFYHSSIDVVLRASNIALIVPLCIMCPIWLATSYEACAGAGLGITASTLSALVGLRVLLSMRKPQHSIALSTDTPDGPTVRFLSSDDDTQAGTMTGRLQQLAHTRKRVDSGILALFDAILAGFYLAALIIYNCTLSLRLYYYNGSPLLAAYIITFLLPATAIHFFFASRYALSNSVAGMHAAFRYALRKNAWHTTAGAAHSHVVCTHCGSHVTPPADGNGIAGDEERRFSAKGPTVYGVEVPRDSDEVSRPETAERDPAPFGQRGDDTALVHEDDSPRVSLVGEQGST